LNLVIIVVAIVVASICVALSKTPLYRLRYLYVTIIILFFVWYTVFLLMILNGFSIEDAIYWLIITAFNAQPLKEPPSNPFIQNLLMVNTTTSFFLLSIILTMVVEYVMRKTLEFHERGIKGLDTYTEWKNHVVFIGWTKALQVALEELTRINPNERIVIVSSPEDIVRFSEQYYREKQKFQNVITVGGDIFSDETLERAQVWKARSIVISLDDDSKTISALLHVNQVIKKRKDDRTREINIVVELLRDEYVKYIKAVDRMEGVRIIPVISRSLVGRLFASAIMEPAVLAFLCDATSITYGVVDLREEKASRIIERVLGQRYKVKYLDLQKKLLEIKTPERLIILGVIKRSAKNVDEVQPPEPDLEIEPDDSIIALRYTEQKNTNCYVSEYEQCYYIDEYEWFGKKRLESCGICKYRG